MCGRPVVAKYSLTLAFELACGNSGSLVRGNVLHRLQINGQVKRFGSHEELHVRPDKVLHTRGLRSVHERLSLLSLLSRVELLPNYPKSSQISDKIQQRLGKDCAQLVTPKTPYASLNAASRLAGSS